MASKPQLPVAHKTLFRADYAASLGYLSVFEKAAREIEATGYPRFEVEGTKISLFDHHKRRTAVLDPAAFIYIQDSGDDAVEVQSIDDIVIKWPKMLDVLEYQRLGLRKWYIIPCKAPFDQLVALFNSRAIRMEELASVVPKVDDTYIRFDCSEDDYRYHIKVGPVRKNEMFRQLEFNRQHLNPESATKDAQRIVDSYPETGVFLDLDFCQGGVKIKAEELVKFLIHGRKRVKEIANNWADFLFTSEGEI